MNSATSAAAVDDELPTVPPSQVRLRVDLPSDPDAAGAPARDQAEAAGDNGSEPAPVLPEGAEVQRRQVLAALGLELDATPRGEEPESDAEAPGIHAAPALLHETIAPNGHAPALIAVLGWLLATGVVVAATWLGQNGQAVAAIATGLGGILAVGLLLVLSHLIRVQEQQRWLLARLVDRLESSPSRPH